MDIDNGFFGDKSENKDIEESVEEYSSIVYEDISQSQEYIDLWNKVSDNNVPDNNVPDNNASDNDTPDNDVPDNDRSVVLDLTGVDSREGFHEKIRDTFDLPRYYGNNLDALHDCLTEIPERMTIIVAGSDKVGDTVKDYIKHFLMMCSDVAEENENIIFFVAE